MLSSRKWQNGILLTISMLTLALFACAVLPLFTSNRLSFTAEGLVSDALPFVEPLRGEINVNTAPAAELRTLPGIGEVLADAIISERESGGLFQFPSDMLAVRGIGEKKLEGILPYIRLDD